MPQLEKYGSDQLINKLISISILFRYTYFQNVACVLFAGIFLYEPKIYFPDILVFVFYPLFDLD